MTCIVGYKKDGIVYIGADSAGVAGLDVETRVDPKVFRVNEFIIGCTTSFRMIQLLRYSLVLPELKADADIYKYMCTEFVDAVRDCFERGGYLGMDKESREDGGTFIVGVRDRMFTVGDDFQIGEMQDPYDSVGCGESYAIGAMEGVLKSGVSWSPEEIVTAALETAAKRSGGVLPPFLLMNTKDASESAKFEEKPKGLTKRVKAAIKKVTEKKRGRKPNNISEAKRSRIGDTRG